MLRQYTPETAKQTILKRTPLDEFPVSQRVLDGITHLHNAGIAVSAPFLAAHVGLGPFKLERWEAGAFIEGSAFEGHALGRPRIDRIKILAAEHP